MNDMRKFEDMIPLFRKLPTPLAPKVTSPAPNTAPKVQENNTVALRVGCLDHSVKVRNWHLPFCTEANSNSKRTLSKANLTSITHILPTERRYFKQRTKQSTQASFPTASRCFSVSWPLKKFEQSGDDSQPSFFPTMKADSACRLKNSSLRMKNFVETRRLASLQRISVKSKCVDSKRNWMKFRVRSKATR